MIRDASAVLGTINLNCRESSLEGRFLAHLYYNTDVMGIFQGYERVGSPHHGGVHQFNLKMPREDIEAFLRLIEEEYSTKTGCTEFLALARNNVR